MTALPVLAAIWMLAIVTTPAQASSSGDQAPHAMTAADSPAAAAQHRDMRKLWTDHVVWTRDYIIAAVGDQPDVSAAADRLILKMSDALSDGIVKQFPKNC